MRSTLFLFVFLNITASTTPGNESKNQFVVYIAPLVPKPYAAHFSGRVEYGRGHDVNHI